MVRSRAESQAETRERILAVAHEAFTTKRVVDVSIDSIAKQAGFSKGAVYSNFASKTDLLFSVLERYFAGVRQDYLDLTLGSAQADIGSSIGSRAGKTQENDLGLFRLLTAVWAEAVHDPDVAERLVTIRRAHRTQIAETITQRATDAGLEMPVDAEALAMGILGMSSASLLESAIDPTVSAEQVHQVMIDLIVAGVAATASPIED